MSQLSHSVHTVLMEGLPGQAHRVSGPCLTSPRGGLEGPVIPSDRPCLSIQLPYLIDGSHKVTQSNAILRYLGRKHKLCEWGWLMGGGQWPPALGLAGLGR